jgi:tripartite-type tricarboxylate transporter receptor subunit TctC
VWKGSLHLDLGRSGNTAGGKSTQEAINVPYTRIQKWIAGAIVGLSAGACAAQGFPNKPIRIIVPWPPGGGTDVFARIIGKNLSTAWQQQMIVDNRPGASGNIGAELATQAPPDGYTILIATITLAISPSVVKHLPFDPLRDLVPITLIAGVPHILVVHPSFPPKSVRQLIVLAKAHPGELDYASAGNGTPFQMAAELFNVLAGTRISSVPYKGGGPAVLDVIAGQVPLTFGNLVAVLPHVRNGRLRGLGVTSAKRSSAAPDIPTIAESGVKGYDFSSWFGAYAPKGTAPSIVQRLNAGIVEVLSLNAVKQQLTTGGADVIASTPQAFETYMKSETEKWARVVKEAGIRAE